MTIKSRIAKLEKGQPKDRPTWKDFVTGAWTPDPDEWRAFMGAEVVIYDPAQGQPQGAGIFLPDNGREVKA